MSLPLRTVASNASLSPRYPLIGSRWKPGHVERRDTERGTYECINSPCETRAERCVQLALLKPIRRNSK